MRKAIKAQIKSQPQHPPLAEGLTLTLKLPFPTSTNALFANVAGKGRCRTEAYNAWRDEAGWELKCQKPRFIAGPVSVAIIFDESRKADTDAGIKAILDLCVLHGIIADDKGKIVRGLTIGWGNVDGAVVVIRRAA